MERPTTVEPQRLHKVMANAGIASRRQCEELIVAGRVRVNGERVTQLGVKVRPGVDRIDVDEAPVGQPQELVYLIMNKPKNTVTTLVDPQGRRKVTDLLEGVSVRVYPVGRLDYDTEGLLILTNDGTLAHALMHPRHEVPKTYVARIRGIPSDRKLRELAEGVELDDGITAPAQVRLLRLRNRPGQPLSQAADVEIEIHEGRNRQVRRMFEAVGHEVIHLARTRIGPIRLAGLPPGQFRSLRPDEVERLRQATGMAVGVAGQAPSGRTAPAVRRTVGSAAVAGQRRTAPVAGARPRPTAPARPSAPARLQPTGPAGPSAPARPRPTEPARPSAPARPRATGPAGPAAPARPRAPGPAAPARPRSKAAPASGARPSAGKPGARPAAPARRRASSQPTTPARPARPAHPGRPASPNRSRPQASRPARGGHRRED